MWTVNNEIAGRGPHRRLRWTLGALALAAWTLSTPTLAGQASTTFQVSVMLLPASPSCSTAVSASGVTQVNCRPMVIGTTSGSARGAGNETPLGYRLPDPRARMAGAVVEVGEESFLAWGEYSSRLIIAGGIEYLEMTVTW